MVKEYSTYLLNPEWQRKRLELFQRDNFACRICGNTHLQLELHHTKYLVIYKYPWDYPNHMYLTLCSNCHTDIKRFLAEEYVDNCNTCYHQREDGYCSCREPIDIKFLYCYDWYPR